LRESDNIGAIVQPPNHVRLNLGLMSDFEDDEPDGLSGQPGNWVSLMGQQPRSLYSDDEFVQAPVRPKSPKSRYQAGDRAPGSNSPRPDMVPPGQPLELNSLFKLISEFQPNSVDIPVHWKPFIPELIPAIGSIDAFIKVPRPDAEFDELGLVIVDEPSITQSNPQILRMELREQYGLAAPDNQCDAYVGSIADVQRNPKALASWLDSLEEIHRNRPPPQVIYTSKMPELEGLMETWPEDMEEVLKAVVLPGCDMDLAFEEYSHVLCSLLEIPVRGNLIESLHCFFSLYSEFEGNQYFQSQRQPTPKT
jgi:intraflagellar transport protein 46